MARRSGKRLLKLPDGNTVERSDEALAQANAQAAEALKLADEKAKQAADKKAAAKTKAEK